MAMSECIRDRRSVNKNGLQNTSAPFGAIFHLLLVLVSLSFRPKKKMLQTLRHDQGDSRSSSISNQIPRTKQSKPSELCACAQKTRRRRCVIQRIAMEDVQPEHLYVALRSLSLSIPFTSFSGALLRLFASLFASRLFPLFFIRWNLDEQILTCRRCKISHCYTTM